jgi:nucleoside-diphosphate-sugar epimerase
VNPKKRDRTIFVAAVVLLVYTFIRGLMPVDDPKVRQPNITRARKVLGWEPKVEFDEGIAKTIEYFKGCLQRGELGEWIQ